MYTSEAFNTISRSLSFEGGVERISWCSIGFSGVFCVALVSRSEFSSSPEEVVELLCDEASGLKFNWVAAVSLPSDDVPLSCVKFISLYVSMEACHGDLLTCTADSGWCDGHVLLSSYPQLSIQITQKAFLQRTSTFPQYSILYFLQGSGTRQ